MKEKLTLSIEKETMERAKRHAKAVGKSISEMVEDFLNELSQKEEWDSPEGSMVEKLAGRFPLKVESGI